MKNLFPSLKSEYPCQARAPGWELDTHPRRPYKLTRDICEARCLGDADKGVNALKGIHRFASIQVSAHPGGVALRKMLTDAEQI
jgi:hypothetical protein